MRLASRSSRELPRALALVAMAALAACSGDANGPEVLGAPSFLLLVAGGDQDVPAGEAPPVMPVFEVQDPGHRPIPGVRVRFSAVVDGREVTTLSALTDAQGHASPTAWRVTTRGGLVETLTASIEGTLLAGIVRARIVGAAPSSIEVWAPLLVVPGRAMEPFPTTPTYRVLDRYRNVVAGARVRFDVPVDSTVPFGGTTAVVDTTPVLTDASGIARPLAYTSYLATAGRLRVRVDGSSVGLVDEPLQFRTCGASASIIPNASFPATLLPAEPVSACPDDTAQAYAVVVPRPARLTVPAPAGAVDVALRRAPTWREPTDLVPAQRGFSVHLEPGVYDLRVVPSPGSGSGPWPYTLTTQLTFDAAAAEP